MRAQFARAVDGLLRAGDFAARGCLVAMMTLIFAEVMLRGFANTSLQITEEIGAYLLVATLFFSIGPCVREGLLLRVDVVYRGFDAATRRVFDAITTLAGAAVLGVYVWQLWRLVASSWRRGALSESGYGIPLWAPQSVMLVGAALVLLAFLAQLAAPAAPAGDGEPSGDKL